MTLRSRATLLTNIATTIQDNTSGDITEAEVRAVLQDIVDSALNLSTDYEAGSYTPTVSFSGGGGSFSGQTLTGRYVKVNKLYWISFSCTFIWSGSPSGNLQIALPATVGTALMVIPLNNINNQFSTWGGARSMVAAIAAAGATHVNLRASGAALQSVVLDSGNMTSGGSHVVAGAGVYESA